MDALLKTDDLQVIYSMLLERGETLSPENAAFILAIGLSDQSKEVKQKMTEKKISYHKLYYQRTKEKNKENKLQYYQAHREERLRYGRENRERSAKREALDRQSNPAKYLFKQAKKRAKKKGLAFNITIDDIVVPEVCPILGIPLVPAKGLFTRNSPSLDRINNSLGYIKGNVAVISYKANRIKHDMAISDLRRFAKWILEVTKSQ